jgi:hypothetical protein
MTKSVVTTWQERKEALDVPANYGITLLKTARTSIEARVRHDLEEEK